MNARQRNTLEGIFEKPIRSDIAWAHIENLLKALGATISEGKGSRVRVALKGVRGVFHRPHPARVADRGQVASVRTFLEHAGIRP